jgi:AraC-like DNA-binding protein
MIGALFHLVVSIYLILQLRKYEKSLYNQYAELSDRSLQWLINTILGGLVLTFIWLGTAVFDYMPKTHFNDLGRLLWFGVSVLIYWIGYAMLMRPEIFIEGEEVIVNPVSLESSSKLSDKTDDHYRKLLQLMSEEKLYRALAKAMDLSKGYLSQIINQKEGKNFFDFINHYRVEDVKEKLNDDAYSHFSILGVALEAGFKSKSTFNAVFKKMTGMTPSQFKMKI